MSDLTPQQIAEIATQAAIAAVSAAMAGGAPAPAQKAEELPDDPEDEREAANSIAAEKAKREEIDRLVMDLLPRIMQPRHLQVFEWLKSVKGLSHGDLLLQIVRAEVARETPNWREAMGAGGASTKNPETLARLKGM